MKLQKTERQPYRRTFQAGGAIATLVVSITLGVGALYYFKPPVQTPLRRQYTLEEVEYFLEVGLGSEYNNSDRTLRKWEGEIRLGVFGLLTAADWTTIEEVIAELNHLIPEIELVLTNSNPNLEIYFVPPEQFYDYLPNAVPGNYGLFWTWWESDRITRAIVLISTVGITQQERNHLIREEITQSLGLMQDSQRYPDSIFYEGWTATTAYSEIDKAVISLLYKPEIRPGMTELEVREVIKQW